MRAIVGGVGKVGRRSGAGGRCCGRAHPARSALPFAGRRGGTFSRGLQVCVVGAGPAGYYAIESLLRQQPLPNDHIVSVSLLEQLPVPFGLVRFGVAPDHPEVKVVTGKFDALHDHPRVHFFGNVRLGRDVHVAELLRLFDAVVLACGAASHDRALNVPGEHLRGVFSAREFVNWYNAHPAFAGLGVQLHGVRDVAVIGNGNVALDAARILLRHVDDLRRTDIADYALAKLSVSTVQRVHLIGRRGVAQASWTAKELRELLTGVGGVAAKFPRADELQLSDADRLELSRDRSRRRCTELLLTAAASPPPPSPPPAGQREVIFRFLSQPLRFSGGEQLESVILGATRLEGDAGAQRARLKPGVEEEIVAAELAVKSVGYFAEAPDENVPFDRRAGVVPNCDGGAVVGVPRLFVCGWLKRGPSGIIGTNKWDAEETVRALMASVRPHGAAGAGGGAATAAAPALMELLRQRHVPPVTTDGWRRIDREEIARGVAQGRPRVKIATTNDMLSIALN